MIFVTDIFLINLNYFLYVTLSFTFKWIFLPFGPLFVQYWLIFLFLITKWTNLMNFKWRIKWIIFVDDNLYYLHQLHLPTCFENISSEYQNVNFSFEDEKLGSLSIFDAKTFRFRLCFISTYPKKQFYTHY